MSHSDKRNMIEERLYSFSEIYLNRKKYGINVEIWNKIRQKSFKQEFVCLHFTIMWHL